jgi:hypothetical protein
MNRTRIDRRALALSTLLALAAVLAACSDSPAPTSPPPVTSVTTTTTTTLPPATVIVQGTTLIPARQVFFTDVTTTSTGRITVTIDYGSSANQMLMWLTDRKCSFTMFDRDDCDYLVKSLEGSKPRVMTSPSVGPGTYTLFVANDGPGDDQVSYKVTLAP